MSHLVDATAAEHRAAQEAQRAASRLQAVQERLALGRGTVADVLAAEAACEAAEARARDAAARRWLRTQAVRMNATAQREAARAGTPTVVIRTMTPTEALAARHARGE